MKHWSCQEPRTLKIGNHERLRWAGITRKLMAMTLEAAGIGQQKCSKSGNASPAGCSCYPLSWIWRLQAADNDHELHGTSAPGLEKEPSQSAMAENEEGTKRIQDKQVWPVP